MIARRILQPAATDQDVCSVSSIDWQNATCPADCISRQLLDFTVDAGMYQFVDFATCDNIMLICGICSSVICLCNGAIFVLLYCYIVTLVRLSLVTIKGYLLALCFHSCFQCLLCHLTVITPVYRKE